MWSSYGWSLSYRRPHTHNFLIFKQLIYCKLKRDHWPRLNLSSFFFYFSTHFHALFSILIHRIACMCLCDWCAISLPVRAAAVAANFYCFVCLSISLANFVISLIVPFVCSFENWIAKFKNSVSNVFDFNACIL